MEGYYDYHPLVGLDRHLTLAGYLSDETRVIGYQLASLTGLPVVDLDRTVEHYAGMSVWKLIWTEGEARYRRLERQHLERAVAASPPGVLTLGDGTLIDPENRRLVLERTDLVALDLDLANCYWRLKASTRAGMDFWHPLHAGPVERFEQVRPFWAARQPGLAEAPHRIPMPGKDAGDVVEALIDLIPTLRAA